jgi:DNA-binding Lrp family transcriptional regulator
MATTDLVIPDRTELAQLSSAELYKLEVLGDISKEILDERVSEWAAARWTQRQIAEELGCSHVAVGNRVRRLRAEGRITTEPDPRGGDRFGNGVTKEDLSPVEGSAEALHASSPKPFSVPEMSRKGYVMSLTDLIQDMKQFPAPWNMSDEYQRQIGDAIQYLQSL